MRLLAALLMSAALLVPAAAHAEGDKMPTQRQISISASGSVSVKPDQVAISIGVMRTAKTAKSALEANSAAMRPIIETLKASGIEARDIQTSNFSVQAAYDEPQNGKPAKIIGYQVANSVQVRLRAIEKLGDVLDRVVDQGSNQINSIQFIVSKEAELKDSARKAAVANAQRMAKTYADAAGVTLGDVLMISEGEVNSARGPFMAQAAMKDRANSAPIEAGEQQLDVQVNMIWAIK